MTGNSTESQYQTQHLTTLLSPTLTTRARTSDTQTKCGGGAPLEKEHTPHTHPTTSPRHGARVPKRVQDDTHEHMADETVDAGSAGTNGWGGHALLLLGAHAQKFGSQTFSRAGLQVFCSVQSRSHAEEQNRILSTARTGQEINKACAKVEEWCGAGFAEPLWASKCDL